MSDKMIGLATADLNALANETRVLLALRDRVIEAWKSNVQFELARANDLVEPILENTMPSFHESLALLLTPEFQTRSEADLATIATEHGGERARMTRYDTTALIHELQIFRRVLFQTLDAEGVFLAPAQVNMLHTSIDVAVRESANAFAGVQAALREQFAAALVHDLRTPLGNAHLAAELIERASSLPQAQGLAKRILQNTARIEKMATELLDNLLFVGGDRLPLRIEPFDMAVLADEIATHTATFHGVDIRLDTVPVMGYWCRGSVQRALENLVSNAIKYGDQSAPIQLWVQSTGARVKVSLHNEGAPIPLEDTESLFQLYHRAEAARKKTAGWGVGLPFVRRVAESHGGSVLVSSTAEGGTTFSIDMPVDARPFDNAPTPA
ncbi:MAG TPA: HAMP domain-containing sensor histidine kinase [Telluria sp.]